MSLNWKLRKDLSLDTSIKDVAKEAGVSVATVSHVLNNTRYVSPELIKRVKDSAKRLDYQPNFIAGSLRSKKTGTIGLVIPDASNLFFAYMATYIEEILRSFGYNLFLCNSFYDLEKEKEIISMLQHKRTDGILIVPEATDPAHLQNIKHSGTHIVIIERELAGSDIDSVIIDNKKASEKATEYLITLGHRNIGYVDRIEDKSHSIDRKEGYFSGLKKNHIPVNEDLLIRSGFSCEDGYQAAKYFLGCKEKVSAMLTFSDFASLGAIRYIWENDLRVPDDISVIGFTDMPISPYTVPSLTTIHYPVLEMTRKSCDLLIQNIKNPNTSKVQRIVLQADLIIRESTGPYNNRAIK